MSGNRRSREMINVAVAAMRLLPRFSSQAQAPVLRGSPRRARLIRTPTTFRPAILGACSDAAKHHRSYNGIGRNALLAFSAFRKCQFQVAEGLCVVALSKACQPASRKQGIVPCCPPTRLMRGALNQHTPSFTSGASNACRHPQRRAMERGLALQADRFHADYHEERFVILLNRAVASQLCRDRTLNTRTDDLSHLVIARGKYFAFYGSLNHDNDFAREPIGTLRQRHATRHEKVSRISRPHIAFCIECGLDKRHHTFKLRHRRSPSNFGKS